MSERNKSNFIELEDITVAFTVEDKEIKVFDKLNLSLDPKACTVIIGKSGCGKTTLLRLLAGLTEPQSGVIRMPAGLKPGMMFQEARLMPWLTVEKNITLGMPAKTIDKAEVAKIIGLVGLEGFERALPSQLSGGMQQRTSLARTLIRKSNLILMDESFGALDVFTRQLMQQELIRIREETGAGIVFVTHDINEAAKLGDRIITIEEGGVKEGIGL